MLESANVIAFPLRKRFTLPIAVRIAVFSLICFSLIGYLSYDLYQSKLAIVQAENRADASDLRYYMLRKRVERIFAPKPPNKTAENKESSSK